MEKELHLEASMKLLAQTYLKILRVDLTEDSHIDIKLRDFERAENTGYRTRISDWLREFAIAGQVYYADVEQYLRATDIQSLRAHFRHSDEWMRLRYRRASEKGGFRWAQMEIIKAEEYTDEKQIVMLYIQDIHDSYVRELEERRELEYYYTTDELTGLENVHAYHNKCDMIADSVKMHDIGVLFADMNCLKIVNDSKGHEAGNLYIREFSKLLTKHFGRRECYRISGDEFLVVRTDEATSDFEQKAETFDRLLKAEDPPMASVGWHVQKALEVGTVTAKAETRMYLDKQQFYEQFPEYRREAVEQRYRSETDFLMDVLTESYRVLLIADLEKDTYRILRQMASVNQGEATEGIYSVRNDTFCDEFVSEEFIKLRRRVGSIANLRQQLRTEKHIICDYRLKNGQWRESTFWKMEGDEQGAPVKIMYYSQDIDHSMINRLSRRTEAERKYSITAGLRETYSAIMVIHLDTDEVELDENLTLPDGVAKYFEGYRSCNEARDYLVSHFLAEEEEERFRHDTDMLFLRKKLRDQKVASFFYRIRPGFRGRGGAYSYCKLSFCRTLNEEDHLLILATKDITDVVKWGRETEREETGRMSPEVSLFI